ncbi:MAG: outer membrane protein assembly factor BamD [Nitrospirota bacterium]|nr:outer membrane protein assembly factor BamD [Nitrospirota bacterium]
MSKPLQLPNLISLILTMAGILGFSAGCSGTPQQSSSDPPFLGDTDEQIFVGDSLEMNYDPNVIMKRAESFYEKESYPEALVEYQHFLDLHHTHILAPYAQYKLALSHFKMIQTIDRDINPIHKALEELQKLSEAFPGSRYEAEAKEKIQECHALLAQHHLFVGKFYYRKESYLAAAKRFTTVAETYPHLDAAAEAKYRLAQTYKQLGAPEWSRDWLEALLRENPNHSFRKEGLELLAELQKENPTLVVAQNLDSFQQAFQGNGNSSVNGFATPSPSVPISLTSGSKSPVNGFSVNQPSQVYNQVTDCPLGVWCDTASISSALPFPRDPIPNTGICRPGEWC